jgi:hypothetical protein
MNGTLAHELFARARFASHRVVMDGFNGTVGAYTLGTTCPPNVTYMGVATCGQTLTGDTTGAVSGSPLLPCVTSQQLMTHCLPHTRTPAHSAHSQRRLCVAVVTNLYLRAYAKRWHSAGSLSVSSDPRTVACVRCYELSLRLVLKHNPLQIDTGVGWPVAPENWYAFNAPYNGDFVFDSCGSSFDTYVVSEPLTLISEGEAPSHCALMQWPAVKVDLWPL